MFDVVFSARDTFPVAFSPPSLLNVDFAETIIKPIADYYTGSYEYTPAAEEQTIPIDGLVATGDITIKAIPQNYGLIIWDGTTITVR